MLFEFIGLHVIEWNTPTHFAVSRFNNLFLFNLETEQIYFLIIIFSIIILTLFRNNYRLKLSQSKNYLLFEIIFLIIFAIYFMRLLVSSHDLITLYVLIEGLSLILYILAGINYNSEKSIEASIKYFALGALSSGILLFGISLIYTIVGSTNFSVIYTYLFKLNSFFTYQNE